MRKVFTMKDLILAKWNDILNILENEHGISHIMIHTWIEPLKIYSVEDKVYFTLTRITDREA